ncbi:MULTISPECIES: alanyl-tRNA editing protein [unclassified Mesorhizobium]|jgi:misacylated tRNA(Ala) deacylase|uniref:alanyl-tRNA editing protein n=1 Tax=unclassified Mesorhizobium TaxID=325217 RepID=UPI00086BB560|nr:MULTISPECIES: alanyl-tRNA editing protein [unclassified Mesorhizobium]MBN9254486.1 alanyl-tRNA editing protein [Mesorhizobium sp.]ODT17634.1 MAG: Ala-tRNA(Pro) hydrolase [Mesorhizobium sp. SCN 65-12]OJX78393.1 MAG: Ala-tRNA(Pro) hydrolase [Mesorhizobium sp. 65-26]
MSYKTQALFRDDAYLKTADATVVAINERGGIILDRTIFYATSGGQPGDTGYFQRADGSRIAIAATITGETKEEIIHVPAPEQPVPAVGEQLTLVINWDRRHLLMRMHAACHLLTVVCPFPITGAAVAEDDSRVDFDIPDASFSKEEVTAGLMELVRADHPIFTRLITDEELAANPGLVKSKNVRPPVGTGKIRLVCIGKDASIDSQPCGGTHVKSTGEVGEIHIGKIEKKGRENRRFRIRFGPMPAA